jgi:hypothetical protein
MRFSHCPEIIKICQNTKNHKIFTLPRNHEKPSKCLKIMKAMRLSHCPEIMKKPSKCLKIMKAMRLSHCPEIMKNRLSV